MNTTITLADGAAAGFDPAAMADELSPYEVFHRVGELTRKLHDALHALGYHQDVEQAVGALPDARARLDYVADLTEKAAERVLTAAEAGTATLQSLEARAKTLQAGWDAAGDAPDGALLAQMKVFIGSVCESAAESNERFSEIMLAQDFHDLTGQTIHRIVKLASNLEQQLVKLLLDTTPPERRAATELPGMAGGPVVPGTAAGDVVTDQAQVDDLLESLGF